jgi:hypothetical protein
MIKKNIPARAVVEMRENFSVIIYKNLYVKFTICNIHTMNIMVAVPEIKLIFITYYKASVQQMTPTITSSWNIFVLTMINQMKILQVFTGSWHN